MAQIAETAFRLLREEGFPAVTARSIASALGASTMPIYSAMGSMDALTAELRKRALAVLDGYQLTEYTENPYLNQAVGYVKFSQNERNLFRFLFIESPVSMEDQDAIYPLRRPDGGARSQWFGPIDEKTLGSIAFKSYFFVHGLATALALGTAGPFDDVRIVRLLEEAGGAFVLFEKKTTGGSL